MRYLNSHTELLNEANIKDDTKGFAEDLINDKITLFTKITRGSNGRFIIKLSTNDKTYNDLKKDIESNYKKMDIDTTFSSNYYYSKTHKLYFYFYTNDRNDKSFKPGIDKMITWDYHIVVLRTIPKSDRKKQINKPHPKNKLHQNLLDTIKQREEQLNKVNKNDPDREYLENELKVAKSKLRKIKSKYKFENLYTFNGFILI